MHLLTLGERVWVLHTEALRDPARELEGNCVTKALTLLISVPELETVCVRLLLPQAEKDGEGVSDGDADAEAEPSLPLLVLGTGEPVEASDDVGEWVGEGETLLEALLLTDREAAAVPQCVTV